MLISYIISKICNSRIGEVILINDNITFEKTKAMLS